MTISLQKQIWRNRLLFFYLSLCVVLCWQCEQEGQVVVIDKDSFSVEDQAAIGKTMRDQLLNMPEVYPLLEKTKNQCAYERVEILYNTLLNTSTVHNRRAFNWDVHIIDDEAKNAFMLPGGHLFVYSGLMKHLETESELVAVIGHEIAYADQAFTLNAMREEHGNVTISSLCSENNVPELPEIVMNLPKLNYEEAIVKQADEMSISLICPFQYDAKSLSRFIEKAEQEQIPWIQSKGGNLAKRLANIEQLAANCGIDEATFEERYSTYKSKCLQ